MAIEALKSVSLPLVSAIVFCYVIHSYVSEGLVRFFMTMAVTIVSTIVIMYFFTLNSREKVFIKELIKKHRK